MVGSSNHSEGKSGGVSAENGRVAPAPKFKQRNVSVIRDFSPGCGRVTALIARP
ncbi:hypothetical protein J1N35_001018, partial [Gossypium stocksii]